MAVAHWRNRYFPWKGWDCLYKFDGFYYTPALQHPVYIKAQHNQINSGTAPEEEKKKKKWVKNYDLFLTPLRGLQFGPLVVGWRMIPLASANIRSNETEWWHLKLWMQHLRHCSIVSVIGNMAPELSKHPQIFLLVWNMRVHTIMQTFQLLKESPYHLQTPHWLSQNEWIFEQYRIPITIFIKINMVISMHNYPMRKQHDNPKTIT